MFVNHIVVGGKVYQNLVLSTHFAQFIFTFSGGILYNSPTLPDPTWCVYLGPRYHKSPEQENTDLPAHPEEGGGEGEGEGSRQGVSSEC